jgi:hypothetical protein
MTSEEEQRLYRVLFEGSDEEVGSEVYELYDTVDELIQNRATLPQIERVLQ